MGEIDVNEADNTVDLLTLIGKAIERLRQSIELFDSSNRSSGVEHLSAVIDDIDAYLDRLDDDPLLKLAALPSTKIREGLDHVRTDLSAVIHDVQRTTT